MTNNQFQLYYQSSMKKKNKTNDKKLDAQIKEDARDFKKQFAQRTLNLITSAFGLVAALAWNDLIKEFVKKNLENTFGKNSGIISQLIYALVVTSLAVFVTYHVGKLAENDKKSK